MKSILHAVIRPSPTPINTTVDMTPIHTHSACQGLGKTGAEIPPEILYASGYSKEKNKLECLNRNMENISCN